VFRYAFGSTTEKYTFTANDLRFIVATSINNATGMVVPIVSWRLRSVDMYVAPISANLGRVDLPVSLRFAGGLGSLDADSKVVDVVDNAYNGAAPSHSRIVPPKDSVLGFWHSEVASGDVIIIQTAGGVTGVVDIALDFIMGTFTEGGSITASSSGAFSGLKQRVIFGSISATGLTPIGLPNYSP
jgi:hypothetical protein